MLIAEYAVHMCQPSAILVVCQLLIRICCTPAHACSASVESPCRALMAHAHGAPWRSCSLPQKDGLAPFGLGVLFIDAPKDLACSQLNS
eukprot:1142125-Pelagomonas_calceolata.AAC.2